MKIYLLVLLLPFFGNTQDTTTVIQKKTVQLKIVQWPDTEATFPGGNAEMMQFIIANLVLPYNYAVDEMLPRIDVSFVIDSTGKIRNIKIKKGFTKEMNDAVIKMMRKMPNWIPATIAGKNVNTQMRFPIEVYLE